MLLLADAPDADRTWWKESIVYEIYPRSFQDSNGDGIGDLPGVIDRLDYLAWLGVDVVWLGPMYQSPNADNGYDVSDYRAIMDAFGTMDDFDRLLDGIHDRGMRLILDLVVNHTSDEHRWFQDARSSLDNPYRDYYFWEPPAEDGGPPTDWVSIFGGPAWSFDELTGQYYLHLFDPKQPDLNWENPDVRAEVYDIMRFWLDKGVDGFRMDVIPFISKDLPFRPFPDDFDGNLLSLYANGPRVHEFLQEMHGEVLRHYDIMTIGEGPGIAPEQANDYVGRDRNELDMIFDFDLAWIDRAKKNGYPAPQAWSLPEMKRVVSRWNDALGTQGWTSSYLGNHDLPRMVSRFGDDGRYRRPSAKLLATLVCTLRGTPTLYQGDELGMTNVPFRSIDDYRDVQSLNYYRDAVEGRGTPPQQALDVLARVSRDHARTPMQWSDAEHAGFTTGTPWIMVNPNYPDINAQDQREDEHSVLRYHRDLIRLCKEHAALTYGTYEPFALDDRTVWAYRRRGTDETLLVVLNVATAPLSFFDASEAVPDGTDLTLLLSNYATDMPDTPEQLRLRPYETRVYRVD
jgi:oligo-1,6-glucosidase